MRFRAIFLVPLVFFAAPLAALTLDNVLYKIETKEKELRNIQFQFKQEIEFRFNGIKSMVEGEATIARKGRINIRKRRPQEQITISDGKRMWVYSPVNNQVWAGARRKFLDKGLFPKGLLPMDNYMEGLREEYKLSLMEMPNGDVVWLKAVPKDPRLDYRLELSISTKSWVPVKTIYTSESATIVTTFTEIKENQKFSDNIFTFFPPKGTEIIPF